MKKLFLNFITLSLLASTNVALAQNFSDIKPEHPSYKYVTELAKDGVVAGYPDGTFKPEANITKAEFATMAIKALKLENEPTTTVCNFQDVNKNHWAYSMLEKAVHFDLIKNTNTKFLPESNVSRGHVTEIVINSLTTDAISEKDAKNLLANHYSDSNNLTQPLLTKVAQAEKLGILVKYPKNINKIAANEPATRAEMVEFLYKMKEQANITPNQKIAEVKKPKLAEGVIIDHVTIDGNIVTIPAGTIIKIKMSEFLSSQSAKTGQLFMATIPHNYITKENYLLISADDKILGQILELKKAKWFVQNGKMVLETKNIKTKYNQTATFEGLATAEPQIKGFWQKLFRTIFKNAKICIYDKQYVCITLINPIKIDVTTGLFAE